MNAETVNSPSDGTVSSEDLQAARASTAAGSICQPEGLMFDAFGEPRKRYVRITFDGQHLILSPAESEAWKEQSIISARAIGQDDPHSYSDVYLSEREFDDLPEFDGF